MAAPERPEIGLAQARWPLILVLAATIAGGGYAWGSALLKWAF